MTITEISPAANGDLAPKASAPPGFATSLPATIDVATSNHYPSRATTSAAPKPRPLPLPQTALRPTSPAATDHAMPNGASPLGDQPVQDRLDGHASHEAHTRIATGPILYDPSESSPDHFTRDVHSVSVGAGPILYDPALYLLAAQLDAIEGLRIASQNRHRMATRDVADSDGRIRGLGLTEDNPAVKRSAVMLDALEKVEHQVVLGLNRLMRAHPLGPWQKATRGVGEKQLARLLACIGDPFWNTAKDEPRTVSQLWAYCGLHVLPAGGNSDHLAFDAQADHAGVAARRAKGQRANWSTAAKTKAYLIAESCLKAGSYRNVYDDHKARAAATVHAVECKPCKAKAGTPLAPGHQHARAMRAMSKQILKDLWIEARRIHGGATS